jgi:hypothetical protein
LFLLFLFLKLLTQQLGSRHPSDLNQLPRLEPAISQLKFIPDGFPQEVKLVDRATELGADIGILLVREMPMLILPKIVPVKAALQGEGVCDHELLPRDYPARAELVGLHLESAVLIVK